MSSEESYLAVLKASYDYDPQPDAEDEIALKEDQLLLLIERTDDDWWKVKVKTGDEEEGPTGLVPAAYVEPATHSAVVKALYDYEAAQPGELTVKEDDELLVFEKDEDWWLVSLGEGGKAGYVPGNYCGDGSEDDGAAPSTSTGLLASQIVIPDSPPRPAYVDPADRVASNKAQADDIKTWSISEVDKKGKKKKGTLGVGNGAIFFASESDKTPVQKWQTADVSHFKVEKSKHVHIDISGTDAISLHFHAGTKDVAEEIITKLESSRALSKASSSPPPAALQQPQEPIERPRSSAKSVHFDQSEPEIIPPPEQDDGDDDEPEPEPEPHHVQHDEPIDTSDGDPAMVLYDFTADGEDELSVKEGEALLVLERDSDEWWKVRNSDGLEGVVPASYVELLPGANGAPHGDEDDEEDDTAALASEAAAAAAASAEAERAEAERKAAATAEKERKKQEAEHRAKMAAAAAEADRRRREQERERQKEKEKERAARASVEDERVKKEEHSKRKSNGDSSSSRGSVDKRGPPTGDVRTWHDRTGQFRVDAAFLGFANGKLRLHKVNGVVIEVPAEKMSAEDLKYVEAWSARSTAVKSDDDDEPLEHRRKSLQPKAKETNRPSPPKKGPTVDWFDFFLSAGCDVDDCTRYASSFERDKIDESILPDITDSTMRSLGLREGDIIRVQKAIAQRNPVKQDLSHDKAKQDQMRRDEEIARQLQAEEHGAKRGQAPNLFAGGPNGALKNSVRRGRPQPSKSLPPSAVDLGAISTAGSQIQRGSTPLISSPGSTPPSATSPPPVQAPSRSSSAVPAATSGFDDDAWTNRPSSTKPLAPSSHTVAPRAPSAPPAPPPAAPTPPIAQPALVPAAAPVPAQIAHAASSPPATTLPPAQSTGNSLAKTTEADVFDQLARLSQLRVTAPAPPVPSPSAVSPPPRGFSQGMGMGSSPAPMAQHLQAQATGMFQPQQQQQQIGPRGPYAPIPANQGLLQPLVPTSTGFNNFVPTRPQSTPTTFQSQPFQQQPSFLSAQPTGFGGPQPTQPLLSQPTGFSGPTQQFMPQQPTGFVSAPMLPQATGIPNGGFGGYGGGMNNVPPMPPLPTGSSFGSIQSNPTGFNPGFGQSPFNNPIPSPPQPQSPQNNTNPANIFAAMKSGTFASDNSNAPQASDKYDALRPNPMPLTAQSTGWGYQGMNGMPGGYGYQR
ncbi:cytoskeletal protein binding protein [Steccherinum ochraceum]|uniref:Actin cytoskeleton-regulatory complex protein SLA1 n=1 Tax=Steccherinum ochraceum TaxID=92696 RepID=A0A4R0RNM3_9APHY|nr:cytoskeletal protein binding protein [Steccherinum ochraceum]